MFLNKCSYTKIQVKWNSATKVFTLDGSNKTHPKNLLGRASTTLPGLALARFDFGRSLLYCLRTHQGALKRYHTVQCFLNWSFSRS